MRVLTKLKHSKYSKLVIVTHIADYTASSTLATIGESQVVILTVWHLQLCWRLYMPIRPIVTSSIYKSVRVVCIQTSGTWNVDHCYHDVIVSSLLWRSMLLEYMKRVCTATLHSNTNQLYICTANVEEQLRVAIACWRI